MALKETKPFKFNAIILLIIPLLAIFNINSFIGIFAIIFLNKSYHYRNICFYNRCGLIAYESGLSFSSDTKSYLYVDVPLFPFPFIDERYVSFGDGVVFCIKNNYSEIIEIISSYEPDVNNIPKLVSVTAVGNANVKCEAPRY